MREEPYSVLQCANANTNKRSNQNIYPPINFQSNYPMPHRYNWIQRRSRNATGSSSTDSSPVPDVDSASSSHTAVNTSPNKGSTNPNLDLSAALVPPSREDDPIHDRHDLSSPSYLTTLSRSSMNSQQSPSFRKQHRRFVDDDEEGSSVYFISEPSLSEDCRSVENSNSPTSDLYTDHGGEGMHFSPMQLVRKKAYKLVESPTSGNDSLQESSDDLIPGGLKLHTIHSSIFERDSSSASDQELERILTNDQNLDVEPDSGDDGAPLYDRKLSNRNTHHRSITYHQAPSSNSDGIHLMGNVDNDGPTQLMKSNLGSHSSLPLRSDEKKGGKFHRWSFPKAEFADENKILHPTVVHHALHLEQALNPSGLPQVSLNERIDMTQSNSNRLTSSSSHWVKANTDGRAMNPSNHPALLPSGNIPESDSTSTLSSPDSAHSRSSSPFSWISNKKKVDNPISVDTLDPSSITVEDVGEVEKHPLIHNGSKKVNIYDLLDEDITRRNFPRQSATTNFSFFETEVSGDEAKKFPTFVCPRCKMRQREFFTVATVPGQFESPAGYLAIYFAIYVVASLYIFGLEEGWPALDCVYFSVITLTTTGLGDFVPTSDGAKIVCSIFIYFGVACIGLFIGSLLASSLDETSRRVARETLISNCPKCARIENNRMQSILQDSISEGADRMRGMKASSNQKGSFVKNGNSGQPTSMFRGAPTDTRDQRMAQTILINNSKPDVETKRERHQRLSSSSYTSQNTVPSMQSSPTVSSSGSHSRFLTRQLRTRHNSIDLHSVGGAIEEFFSSAKKSLVSSSKIDSSLKSSRQYESVSKGDGDENSSASSDNGSDDESESSDELGSTSSEEDAPYDLSGVKSAKYVFLTLKQAVANSLLIIAIGSLGFYFIEEMSAVNAFYFTTVLLTTVGYGDIVPQTSWGKLFATIYVLGAGTVLLRNMSMISMIPLELRKRRLERAVLRQFGDTLDEAALRELANGPLVRRLQISEDRPDGLKQCTREMFALVMLIRLGKITEQDVRSTFAAFRRLDLDNDGRLTSKEIILGAVEEERKRVKTREELSKSMISKSPEKRSILINSIRSSQTVDATDQCQIQNTDSTTAERKYLLPRSHHKDELTSSNERYIHGSYSTVDYGSSGAGDNDVEDIEAGKNHHQTADRSHFFPPIAPD